MKGVFTALSVIVYIAIQFFKMLLDVANGMGKN